MFEVSRFKNIYGVYIPPLDFTDLPEYETTVDEEEGEGDEPDTDFSREVPIADRSHYSNKLASNEMEINSPLPHGRSDMYVHGAGVPSSALKVQPNSRMMVNDFRAADDSLTQGTNKMQAPHKGPGKSRTIMPSQEVSPQK